MRFRLHILMGWTQPLCKAVLMVSIGCVSLFGLCVSGTFAIATRHDGFPRVFICLTVERARKTQGAGGLEDAGPRGLRFRAVCSHFHWSLLAVSSRTESMPVDRASHSLSGAWP